MTIASVWGPAGSPGRSSLSIALAAELALTGRKVLLLDLDSYGGAIAVSLDLFDESSAVLAACRLASKEQLSEPALEALLHAVSLPRGELRVLTGMTNTSRWPELSAQRIREVIELAKQLADDVVIDVGFNLDEDEELSSDLFAPRRNACTVSALQASDTVVAVARADVIGLSRFLRAYPELRELLPEKSVLVAANRVRSSALGVGPAQAVRSTLARFAGITELAIIPEDAAAFDRALLESLPLGLAARNSPARKAVRALAQQLREPAPS